MRQYEGHTLRLVPESDCHTPDVACLAKLCLEFLADNDSRYFIHLELIEKFSESGML